MDVVDATILYVWGLATIIAWCSAVYGAWLAHATSVNAHRQRATRRGLAFGESLGSQRWPLVVSYSVRFVLAAGSTIGWTIAFGWLL
jgi:hypothetical protein